MTLKELNLMLLEMLKKANENENIAYFLLEHFLHYKNKLDIIEHQNDEINDSQKILEAANDYINGKPLSKITNKTHFYGLDFIVDNNVFSPRLETELLVEIAIKKIQEKIIKTNKLNIADVCCGTGVIGLSIKSRINDIEMYQSDIDENAYFNTVKNSEQLNIKTNINLSPNLEYYYKTNTKLDVIISNPPYISIGDINVGNNVNKYDPLMALYCGDNGLMVYKAILQQSLNVLNQDSFLIIFEIGYNQAEAISSFASNIYKDINIEIIKDYSGLDRILVISKNW